MFFAATLAGAAALGAVATIAMRGGSVTATRTAPPPVGTAIIERTTLSTTVLEAAQLGFAGSFTVTFPGGTSPDVLRADAQAVTGASTRLGADRATRSLARTRAAADGALAPAQSAVQLAQDHAALAQADAVLGTDAAARAADEVALASDRRRLAADQDLGCLAVSAGGAAGSSGGAATTPSPTASGAPVALTGAATPTSTSTATLAGSVVPGSAPITYSFHFGTTAAMTSETAPVALAPGSSPVSVTASVAGLVAGTTYLFELTVNGSAGSSIGLPASFSTPPSRCSADRALVAADAATLTRDAGAERSAAAAVLAARAVLRADALQSSQQRRGTSPTALSDAEALASATAQVASDEGALAAAKAQLATDAPHAVSGSNVVTALPDSGAVLRRGQAVYDLDGVPVPLFYGNVVATRALGPGVGDGSDVTQLQANLVALGFGAGLDVGPRFTSATALAIEAFQRSIGAPATGTLRLGEVVVAPGPIRVTSIEVARGETLSPGSTVLGASSNERQVLVPLNPSNSPAASVGEAVSIVLTPGSSTSGHIVAIGPPTPGSGSPAGTTEVLTVLPDHPAATGTASSLPVQVRLTTQSSTDVLAAPVAALLALSGGGYGLEVVERSGTHRLVGVRTGLYAGSLVAVSGSGLVPGTKVVVAQ